MNYCRTKDQCLSILSQFNVQSNKSSKYILQLRVLPLVSIFQSSSEVWSVAYEIRGHEKVKAAWESLYSRECKSGGYAVDLTSFYTMDCSCPPGKVLLFWATPKCDLYHSDCSEAEIADEIYNSKGPAGYNIEYVVLLHQYLEMYMASDGCLKTLVNCLESMANNRGERLHSFIRASIPADETFDSCQACTKVQSVTLKFSAGLSENSIAPKEESVPSQKKNLFLQKHKLILQ